MDVVRRRTASARQGEKRAHIVEGPEGHHNIDAVIETIRSSPDVPVARAA